MPPHRKAGTRYVQPSMTFTQKISAYTLKILQDKDLPDIALAGLEEGYDSESLRILAGYRSEDNPFQLVDYFNRFLGELNLTQPNKKSALIDVLNFYGSQIANSQIDPYLGMSQINNIIDQTEFQHNDLELSNCYADYITIWEIKGDGLQLHTGSGLTKEEFIDKTKAEIMKHMSNWLKKYGST